MLASAEVCDIPAEVVEGRGSLTGSDIGLEWVSVSVATLFASLEKPGCFDGECFCKSES